MENLIFDQPAACNLQSVLEGTFIIKFNENRHNGYAPKRSFHVCQQSGQLPWSTRNNGAPKGGHTVHNASQIQPQLYMTTEITKILIGSKE